MELVYILRILYRKKWTILGCTFLAIAAAYFFTRNQKKIFKSGAQLSTGYTVTADLKLSDEIFSLPQIDTKFNNIISDISSPKVLSLLSYRLILNDLSSAAPFRKLEPEVFEKKPELKKIDKTEAIRILTNKRDSIQMLNPGVKEEKKLLDLIDAYEYDIASLRKNLTVARHLRTDYLDIIFRSENPDLSAFVVNSLVKDFLHYYEVFRRERSLESMIALDSLVQKRKQELDKKIDIKTSFLTDSVSSTLDPNTIGLNILGQISQIDASLADEEGKVQDLTYQIAQIDKELSGTGNGSLNSYGDNTQWLALRTQYNDLLQKYQSTGSKDPELKKQLDDLSKKINAAAPNAINTESNDNSQKSGLLDRKIIVEGQLRSAKFKITNYKSKLAELNNKLKSASPTSSASLDRLDKEIEVAQLEYTNAKEKLNLAASMNEGAGQNFKQTLFGQPAIEPEPSKRIVILGLSGLSSFILSSLIFIFIAYIDQSIKTPSQFQRLTDLKLLGTINLINLKQTSLAEQVTQIEEEYTKRNNSFRELLRKLRFEIERSKKRVILFTSTEPRQGKTTLSQALAFSLSLGKKKVLLLDTNFCNNDLTVLNNALPTLEQFSGNGHHDFKDFETLITKTGVDNVDIIGCKGGDYTPSEILPKNHLLNYLPDLLKRYDYIFMEAAPLNGFTDTKELTQFADGVIAIFSATSEIGPGDKESIKFLHELNGKFIGAILNKVAKLDMSL